MCEAQGASSSQSGSAVDANSGAAVVEQEMDPRHNMLICSNCGIPGHFVGNCVKPKVCFICNVLGHPVYSCPEWVKEHPAASYFGSGNSGMGFYHLDVPEDDEKHWLNFSNVVLISIRKGSLSVSDIEKDFNSIFCKTRKWPWQIREIGPGSFLVRFPPWKSVKELAEFPSFDLEKDEVTENFNLVW